MVHSPWSKPKLLPMIKDEFKKKYFIDLKLTNNIKKLILAPREYFIEQNKATYPSVNEIYLCSLARINEVFDQNGNLILNSKLSHFDELSLKIENR